jgi:deoxyadenosine/deoxycytidine kinase
MVTGSPTRLVIIGNSGSGKSTFAERIATALGIPAYDLDVAYRCLDGRERAEDEAQALVTEFSVSSGWVIEGVWDELVAVALVRATVLVWLDLSWDECLKGIRQRGPHYGMNPNDRDDLLAWANAHRDRVVEQAQRYNAFKCQKVRLRTRREVAAFSPARLASSSAVVGAATPPNVQLG